MRFVKSLTECACVRHSLVWCFVKKLINQQEKMGKRVQKMYFFAHFFMPGLEKGSGTGDGAAGKKDIGDAQSWVWVPFHWRNGGTEP